jgi:hypothetical protein
MRQVILPRSPLARRRWQSYVVRYEWRVRFMSITTNLLICGRSFRICRILDRALADPTA